MASAATDSGSIAWEALEEIAAEIEDFWQRRAPSSSSHGAGEPSQAQAQAEEIRSLRSMVESLRRDLEKAQSAPQPMMLSDGSSRALVPRKRSCGGGVDDTHALPDERDLAIKRLTRQLEEERTCRRFDTEKHAMRESERQHEVDKLAKHLAFMVRQEEEAQERLKKRDQEYNAEVKSLEDTIAGVRRDLKESRTQHENTKRELAKARSELSRMTYWQNDAKRSRDRVAELEVQLQDAKASTGEIERLRQEVKCVRRQLEDEKRRREQLEGFTAAAQHDDEGTSRGPPTHQDTVLAHLRLKVMELEHHNTELAEQAAANRGARAENPILKATVQDLEVQLATIRGQVQTTSRAEVKYRDLVEQHRDLARQLEPYLDPPSERSTHATTPLTPSTRRKRTRSVAGIPGMDEGDAHDDDSVAAVTTGRVISALQRLQSRENRALAALGRERERVQELERQAAELREQNQELSSRLNKAQERIGHLDAKLLSQSAHVAAMDRENAALKKVLDMASTRASMIRAQQQGGDGKVKVKEEDQEGGATADTSAGAAAGGGTADGSSAPTEIVASASSGTSIGHGASQATAQTEDIQALRISDLEDQLKRAHDEISTLKDLYHGYASPEALAHANDRMFYLEAEIKKLESRLKASEAARKEAEDKLQAMEERCERTKNEAADEAAELHQTMNELKEKAKLGACRVLHMKDNPTMTKLVGENNTLRQQVASLKERLANAAEEGGLSISTGGGGADTSGGMETSVYNTRLKEAFKERFRVYRDAVFQLTGYLIKLKPDQEVPQVELRSTYAETESDVLIFRWHQGQLQLLETPYARNIPEKNYALLSQRNNPLPAFLASLTLDLYEKQTML